MERNKHFGGDFFFNKPIGIAISQIATCILCVFVYKVPQINANLTNTVSLSIKGSIVLPHIHLCIQEGSIHSETVQKPTMQLLQPALN